MSDVLRIRKQGNTWSIPAAVVETSEPPNPVEGQLWFDPFDTLDLGGLIDIEEAVATAVSDYMSQHGVTGTPPAIVDGDEQAPQGAVENQLWFDANDNSLEQRLHAIELRLDLLEAP